MIIITTVRLLSRSSKALMQGCQTQILSRANYALGYDLEVHQRFGNYILARLKLEYEYEINESYE